MTATMSDSEGRNNTEDDNSITASQNISAFIFDPNIKKLKIIDQTLLPQSVHYVDVPDSERGYFVIKNMLVRGAPCIAAVGCLSIIAELNQPQVLQDKNFIVNDLILWIKAKSCRLISARPTAVNLKNALDKLLVYAETLKNDSKNNTVEKLIVKLTNFCLDAVQGGEALNICLGDYGAEELFKYSDAGDDRLTVLTHCNTGALATVGYGTALGVIRSLRNKNLLKHVYCTETRPYNQGSRLTAWELVKEKISATLIADSMVAYLMDTHKIDAVLVGADCVASNGDTANKIGTLQIAIVAKQYGVPFYVAAPTQSFDLNIQDRSGIKIEQRPSHELRRIKDIILAPHEVDVWNPCFDVTPSIFITGIITEFGVCKPEKIREFISNVDKGGIDRNVYALF